MLAEFLLTGVEPVRHVANLTDLYLQILGSLGGVGGVIVLVARLVKWMESRSQRKRLEQRKELSEAQARIDQHEAQLRADYEKRLLEARERETQLRAERDHWQDQYRQAVHGWQLSTDQFLEYIRRKNSESSKPPPSSK